MQIFALLKRAEHEVIIIESMLFSFSLFAEIEAKEACDWLRAAGFPQYVQLFKGKYEAVSFIFRRRRTARRVSAEMIQEMISGGDLLFHLSCFARQTAGSPSTSSGRSAITTSWMRMPSTRCAGNRQLLLFPNVKLLTSLCCLDL